VAVDVAVLELDPGPAAAVREEADLDLAGLPGSDSISQRGLMSQLRSSRSGGSKASTRAHRQVVPSTPRSNTAPPARGSRTVSAISTPSRLWSRGLRCWETAGRLTGSSPASSTTALGRVSRRSKIA
jgi:hypothetical protein